ncbi:MBL fold metallo-hydrolase RNA specificity domain-containing protein [Bdellovibrio sp. KM01]|uniref:MBL fold metallo-hydrolase RNA specificity domain-containing protein n=1 Tax=Bdellovibrio sp. KM01 TaxID=2748865 RepID=UPI0015E9D837|nr:MBL fold metallo-hydrolase [Bdellovibrio sp. KM01]QLY27305.1 MBL fold metallo-hydrolase [Bdellovibrio sp. KM01]
MNITFLGGAGTVTGSKYLVTSGDDQILVDCGLFQGLKQLRLLNWEKLNIDVKKLKAVILTHAHLDHCGYLPLLVAQGFTGPIYCTPPTLDITKVILEDSARIQIEEADFANKKHFSKHTPAKPLYDLEDVKRTLPLLKAIDFYSKFSVGSLEIQFQSSAHILGAASVYISNETQRLLFSGDIGRYQDPLMPAPLPPGEADCIIMESTYGDRVHDGVTSFEQLKKLLNDCWRRKSVLLIPAFALGRAQNLIYEILQLKNLGLVAEELPIYFNTPMGSQICEIYCKYPDYLRINAAKFASDISRIKFIRSAEESRQLNEKQGPMVIIAASGMLTGGRVLHHLKAFAENSNNTILLAGFQVVGTRGWSIASGAKQVKVHGNFVNVNAQIIQTDCFSAHADKPELLFWLSQASHKPKKVFLVHGEPSASDELRKLIERDLKIETIVPLLNSSYNIEVTTGRQNPKDNLSHTSDEMS